MLVAEHPTPISDDQYTPRGMTPLNDATVRTINDLAQSFAICRKKSARRRLSLHRDDGLENASKEFANRLGGKAENQGHGGAPAGEVHWKFTYVGANVDAISELLSTPSVPLTPCRSQ